MPASDALRALPHTGSDAQRRVDAVQRAIRAGAPPPPELAALVRPGPGDPQALALNVLADLQDAVDRLGDDLVTDPAVLAHHLDALQSLDLIGQSLAALVSLILDDEPHRAIAATALARLRARLVGA